MSYVNIKQVLPKEVIELIQNYVDGEFIYIPRKKSNRKSWGQDTNTKNDIQKRNRTIYKKYSEGKTVKVLADEYFLSIKSIYRIISKEKKIKL